MTRLELRNVGIDVAGKPLIRGLTFDIATNELHVLLGPSGSGKTTILKAIAGLHPITQGEILVDGTRIDHLPPERRGIVLFHQQDTLFPHLDVAGNIAFGMKIRGQNAEAIKIRTSELLKLVGLPGFQTRRIANLSGGERQRVALARALAVEPRLLLLDEPFSALDRLLRQGLRDDVRRILRNASVTTLFVTHDRDEALGVADQLILIRNGQLVDRGAPARVFSRPATPDAARVLGRRNLYPFTHQNGALKTPIGTIPAPAGKVAGAGWVLINEEDIELAQDEKGSGVVEAVEFLGSRTVLRVARGDGVFYVERPGPPTWAPGTRVEPHWRPGTTQAFEIGAKNPTVLNRGRHV